MSDTNLPNPYAPYIPLSENTDRGRVGFMMPNITNFKDHPFIDPSLSVEDRLALNNTLLDPAPNEAYVDNDSHIYVCKMLINEVTGETKITYVSKTKMNEDKFNYYEDQGVLNQLMSSYMNGKIYNFYIDNAAGTIHPNSQLVFPEEYRYYTVREIELDELGRPIYVAGIIRDDSLFNIFVNMEEINDETTGNKYRKMRSSLFFKASVDPEGNPIPLPAQTETIQNGKFYVVEFYDENQIIIDSKQFQGVEAAFLNNDTTIPSNQVVDLRVSVIRNTFPYAGENDIYNLIVGESVDFIKFSIVAVYQDGTTKIITQYLNTERLTMTGFNEIDTNATPNTLFPVTFEYYPNVDPDTGVPVGSSISKTINFKIIETNMPGLYNVIPVLWTNSTGMLDTNTRAIYNLKLYTLTTDGVLQNYTRNMYNTLMIKNPTTNEYVKLDSDQNPNSQVKVGYDPYGNLIIFEALGVTLGTSDYKFELTVGDNIDPVQTIKFQIEMDSEGNARIVLPTTEEYQSYLTTNLNDTLANMSLYSVGATRRFGITVNGSNFATKYGREIGGTQFVPAYARVYLVKDKTATVLNDDILIDAYTNTLTVNSSDSATVGTILNEVNVNIDYILIKYMSNDKSICVNYDTYRLVDTI